MSVPIELSQMLQDVRIAQRSAWERGQQVFIEDYLRQQPELADHDDSVLDLIYSEYCLREELGHRPDPTEYANRFPQWTDSLRRLFELHRAMQASDNTALDTAVAEKRTVINHASSEQPTHIGRYRIDKLLGEGGFGLVYLAEDDQLQRLVAIKVPHARLVAHADEADAYLTEARTVANLDHPHIVPVYDVGSIAPFPCFVVSKFIDGIDLASKLKQGRLTPRRAVQFTVTIAEALHHAHQQGLVHRDIKPANILLDKHDQPFVADFGLAQREQDVGSGPHYVGTPQYMSPEQARGEGHRVDGRSDIFSLGVVLYEMLVGRRPFNADSQPGLLEQIVNLEPRPPRQYDDTIPKELDRICLKALSKRASQRYSTARDMADDLRYFLTHSPTSNRLTADMARQWPDESVDVKPVPGKTIPTTASPPIKIVPKGFRSYDAHDADFFLELLPGTRDRDGLPESIRFWKNRIEELDPDQTFSVGLMYGPSGCGKTSLVKAGLLPQLSASTVVVYVESTANETESRLLSGLRKRCPALPNGLSLKATLAALRRGQGISTEKKVIIILDQFEQWLHAHRDDPNRELVQALRQCDGGQVQCIVMVRDDFWMAVTRFMGELEVPLREGETSAPVDLFPIRHAEKVLAEFGRAFGNLPADTKDFTREQQTFLKQAVASLAQEGKVISVRLALFAEMMKGKPWTQAALKRAGGTEGIRVTFLEESFCAAHAPPEHRYHQQAARSVLKAMLPESGADIKGHMRSYHELLEASGYQGLAKDFDDLLRILDSELRLITPTDPQGMEEVSAINDDDVTSLNKSVDAKANHRYFQLTHDYLVPSLRDWLTGKQKETRRGRAELLLADRAAVWNARSENRQLPSLAQWFQIRALTEKTKWTSAQRKMMKTAGRYHLIRGVVIGSLIAAATFAGLSIRKAVVAKQSETHTAALVGSLMRAEFTQLPSIVNELNDYSQWAEPILRAKHNLSNDSTSDKLRLALAMLPADKRQVDYLSQQLPACTLEQFPILRAALSPHREKITESLWQVVLDEEQNPSQRIQAAAALAEYDPGDERWDKAAPLVVQQLTGVVSMVSLGQWRQWFKPVGGHLTNPLMQVQAHRSRSKEQLRSAGYLLADYLQDEPVKLIDAILIAEDSAEFAPLVEALQPRATEIKPALLDELRAAIPEQLDDTNLQLSEQDQQVRDAHWKRQSLAAVTLVSLGFGEEVWPLMQFSPNPSLRSFIIHYLGSLGTDPNTLAARLRIEPDVTIRQALIQAIGGLESARIAPSDRNDIADHLRALFVSDPDSGLHSSAEWALRRWGVALPQLPTDLPIGRRNKDQQWYVTTHGQTMVMVSDPIASDGIQSDRRFAIASHETTMGEFQHFRPGYSTNLSTALNDEHPAISVSFYMAAEYCNWLSELEGIPKDQWVFEPNGQGKYDDGMIVRENGLELTGYRLPSEAEWEVACRAGTSGSHVFGEPVFLLDRYGWYTANALGRSHPVASLLPNAIGLFDVHGASWEWTQPSDAGSESVVRSKIEGVMRGGAFRGLIPDLRSTSRKKVQPNNRLDFNGFRVAKTFAPRGGITRP